MNQPCRRPTLANIQEQRRQKKQQEKALNAKLRALGTVPHAPATLPNGCSAFATIAEEREARADAVSKQARLLRQELPALLAQLERIPDPRDPRKRRHKLTVLLLYGLLMFVFQFSSRRETNREMTCPQFLANLASWGSSFLGVRSNIHTLSFSTPLGSGNHASLRTASMWRGKLAVFPYALPWESRGQARESRSPGSPLLSSRSHGGTIGNR
jgi:hypothetical protein